MRVQLFCQECMGTTQGPQYHNITITEEGFYKTVCPAGHTAVLRISLFACAPPWPDLHLRTRTGSAAA